MDFSLRMKHLCISIFFKRKIWIINGPLEYYCATSETTQLYPSPLTLMHIKQLRRKPNKYGKKHLVGIEPRTYWSKNLIPSTRCQESAYITESVDYF
ncbi:hypothetical protein Hanom_Chr06g00507541 [Helianthus anomalus]